MSRPEKLLQTDQTRAAAAKAIKAVFERGAAAWNARDLAAYLATYGEGDDVRWISGGKLTVGKAAIAAAVRPRFASGAAMGTLAIKQLQIDIQTPADALVFGAWQLTFEQQELAGVFTVHVRRFPEGWLIVSDHASMLE